MGASQLWHYRSFYLEQCAIDEIARGLGAEAVPYFTRNTIRDHELAAAFISLHHALEQGQDLLRERELMIAAFGALFRRHGADRVRVEPAVRDRPRLRAALDLIHAKLGEPLLLDELSAALGITPYQLIRLFKRTLDLTPHAYITQARLNAARHYLSLGAPIVDAAAAAGFYDQSALTRYFRRCYGITPLQFVRAVRA
jgi:AraC-like DNA-binding protein